MPSKPLEIDISSQVSTGPIYEAIPIFVRLYSFCCLKHFCPNLPAAFSQPGNGPIVQPCTLFLRDRLPKLRGMGSAMEKFSEGQSIQLSTTHVHKYPWCDVSEFSGGAGGGGSRDFSRAAAKFEMSSRKGREGGIVGRQCC